MEYGSHIIMKNRKINLRPTISLIVKIGPLIYEIRKYNRGCRKEMTATPTILQNYAIILISGPDQTNIINTS